MKETTDLKTLLDKVPNANKPGRESRFTGPAPESARRLANEILSGGAASVSRLVGEIVAAAKSDGEQRSYKPEYLLHIVALEVGRPEREAERRMFCETLAAKLGRVSETPKYVQARLIRELQVAGKEEVCGKLGELLPDPELGAPAAQALIAIGRSARAVLRAALSQTEGTHMATVAHAIGVLGDREAAPAMARLVANTDASVRAAATAALAEIGGPDGAKALLQVTDRAIGWERIQATKACLVLAERLVVMKNKEAARAMYTHLRDTRTDAKERYVRDVATRALRELNQNATDATQEK